MPTSLTRWGRPLVRCGVVLGGLSVIFPLVAGLGAMERPLRWIGVLDVVFALAWVMVMMLIVGLAQNQIDIRAKETSYQIYRLLAHLLLVLLAAFFMVGDRINWNVLLPGLAWRLWWLVYTLPATLAVWRIHV